MRLDVMDVENVIRKNRLPQVTNQALLDPAGAPDPAGLYSQEIFGRVGSRERKLLHAWVDLGGRFLHPFAYQIVKGMFRDLPKLIQRAAWWRLSPKGFLEKADEGEKGAGTGLEWLIRNWSALDWKRTGVESREENIRLLKKLKPSETFVSKWIVFPAFYRDMDRAGADGRMAMDDATALYKRLVLLGQAKAGAGDLAAGTTDWRVQDALNQMYDMLTGRLAGKHGLIQRNIQGKSIDYAARGVISESRLDTDTYGELQVPYGHTGVPLHMALVMFFPFVTQQMEALLADFKQDSLVITGNPGKGAKYELTRETVAGLTTSKFERLVNMFARSERARFSELFVETRDGSRALVFGSLDLGRPFTLTDFLFLTALRVVENKHAYVTRYPLEDYRNITPTRIRLLSTEKTIRVELPGGVAVDNYPLLDWKNPDKTVWVNSVKPSNGYLQGFGADFDGDMVSLRGCFTQEANLEAEEVMRKPLSLLDPSGKPSRGFSKEGILTLYNLTMD